TVYNGRRSSAKRRPPTAWRAPSSTLRIDRTRLCGLWFRQTKATTTTRHDSGVFDLGSVTVSTPFSAPERRALGAQLEILEQAIDFPPQALERPPLGRTISPLSSFPTGSLVAVSAMSLLPRFFS